MTDDSNSSKKKTGNKKKTGTDQKIYQWLWGGLIGDRRKPGPIPPPPKHIQKLLRKHFLSDPSAYKSVQVGNLSDSQEAHDVTDFLASMADPSKLEITKVEIVCSQPKVAYRVFKSLDLGVDVGTVDLPDLSGSE